MVYETESVHFSDFFFHRTYVLEHAGLRFGDKLSPRLQACIFLKLLTTLQLLTL